MSKQHPSEEEMISQAQYRALMEKLDGFGQSLSQLRDDFSGLDTAIRGNGQKGLMERVGILEAMLPVQIEHAKDDVQDAQRLTKARLSQKISWEWVAVVLLQVAFFAFTLLTQGG